MEIRKKYIYTTRKNSKIIDEIRLDIIYKKHTISNIINLLNCKTNQPYKFKPKHWLEIIDDSCQTYSTET